MLRQLKLASVLTVQRSLAKRLIYNGLAQKKSGLFGVECLQTSSDFRKASEHAIKTIDYIKSLLKRSDLSPKQTLLLLDSISNELCRAIDVAELCRNVHALEEFQTGAEESFESLSSYIHNLNSDRNVYLKLVQLMNSEKVWHQFTEEERLFVIDLRNEFEADGIHLEGQQKKKGLELQGLVVASETKYSQNASGQDSEILIGPFPAGVHIQHLKQWLANYIPQRTFRNSQAYLICNGDRRIYDALLRSIDQEYVRRQLYCSTLGEPQTNIKAFGALIKERQALAKCLGFESFAHKFLKNKVARTPENVLALLKSVNEASQVQALAELRALAELKQSMHPSHSKEVCENPPPQSSGGGLFGRLFAKESTDNEVTAGGSGSSGSQTTVEVNPWDVQYLCGHLESLSFASDHNSSETEHEDAMNKVQEFLHIDTCLEGLKQVTHTLFGISIQECHMDEHERWTISDMSSGSSSDDNSKQRRFQTDIKKFVVMDEDCEVLGTVYMDLFMRPNKFSGAAHFTVSCGCTTLDTTALQEVLRGGGELVPPSEGSEVRVEGVKQLPSIAIVFNFKNLSNGEGEEQRQEGRGRGGRPTLMSLHSVETLYHEWGHALHSLLSKTQFQHLSGTRGGVDFVEVPSHLMEFFARSPEVIQTWARHYKTSEEVPLSLVQSALRKKEAMPALELQHQILLSAMDQFVFGPALGDVSSLSPEEVFFKALTGLVAIQKEYTVLPTARVSPQDMKEYSPSLYSQLVVNQEGFVELPALHLLNHTHLINYGGGYYSYLFAKMYAAQIWAKKFAANPLSRTSGQLLYKNMLIYGSGKEPRELLRDLAEGPLDPSHYFKYVLSEGQPK